MQSRIVYAVPGWKVTEKNYLKAACIVSEWEIVTVRFRGLEIQHVYGTVVSDYKLRWKQGDYVFTSKVVKFEMETGLVETSNSLYCLSGDGEVVFATLDEAFKMKTFGQSIYTIREVERNIGEIKGPHQD